MEVGQNYTAPGPATGPLGSTAITLNNGTLVLGATSATAATTFDMVSGNAVTLSGANDTILASAAALNGSITLAGSNPVAIAASQTLNLAASNGYTLNVSPGLVFNNSGTLSLGPGTVNLPTSSVSGTGQITLVRQQRPEQPGEQFLEHRDFRQVADDLRPGRIHQPIGPDPDGHDDLDFAGQRQHRPALRGRQQQRRLSRA